MADVSRNVVASLLVLVIIVSGISTYYFLWGAPTPTQQVSGPNGQVKLSIIPSGETESDSSTVGNVALKIEPRVET